MATKKHPAPFTPAVLDAAMEFLPAAPEGEVLELLDPFAGVGQRLAEQVDLWNMGQIVEEDGTVDKISFTGIELEPDWDEMHQAVEQGDARALRYVDATFDAILTSPCYGNRMADLYAGDAKGSRRFTYAVALGRRPAAGSSAALQWGKEYRILHVQAWREARRVLKPGGRFILNISDHIRDGKRMRVSAWHISALLELGFNLVGARTIGTPRMKHGQNYEARVEGELIVAFDRDLETDGRLL